MDIGNLLHDLGMDPNAQPSPEELKKKWREECLKNHPDKGGDGAKFRKITHAYKMLTDVSYRHEDNKEASNKSDLCFQISLPISFEDAFFGRTKIVAFNQIECDLNMQPMDHEKNEITTLTIPLPAGCCSGHKTIVEGKGIKCGDEVGDVTIIFAPIGHPKFKLEELDVVATEKIPLDIALKGGTFEVQTMYGLETLKVPAGSKPGDKLVVPDRGVMKKGSHIVTVDIEYPDEVKLKSEAWKGLDINWDIKVDNPDKDFEKVFMRLGGRIR